MSLRCKACDKPLDTSDPDYCSKCLQCIRECEVDRYTPVEDTDILELVKEISNYEIHKTT